MGDASLPRSWSPETRSTKTVDRAIDDLGPFASSLGLELDTATGDEVTAHWSVLPQMLQPYGILHGGVHCSVVETLASVGAALWLGDRGKVVGVSNSTDFYRASSEGALTSSARPLHRGRSQQVWLVETLDDRDRIVARGQVRLQNLNP
jgi:1,4-dihydroxy-2-naphthoyl-CoA hydrolase